MMVRTTFHPDAAVCCVTVGASVVFGMLLLSTTLAGTAGGGGGGASTAAVNTVLFDSISIQQQHRSTMLLNVPTSNEVLTSLSCDGEGDSEGTLEGECQADALSDATSGDDDGTAGSSVVVNNDEYDDEDEEYGAYDGEEEDPIVEASYQVGSPASMKEDRVGSDMGEPQLVDTIENSADIANRISEARRYMQDVVHTDPKYNKVRSLCLNKNSQCAFWAVSGECDINPGYMHIHCGPVCQTCEKLHVETRCPLDPDAVDSFTEPGDLNRMFETIVSDPLYAKYEPVVLSRPGNVTDAEKDNAAGSIWMIMFDNAVSDDEADRLIELGQAQGYERSADVGSQNEDGTYEKSVNNGRTSTNAWCVDDCYTDPIAQTVMERIANITGVPEVNSENLQLLKYDETQFYRTHNDFIEYQVDRPCGVRALTFYIYLNDVEEGGGTNFPKLGLTVTPKKGRAVLWPSVYDSQPNVKDPRSDHQALPVKRGIKYGANAWIHQRNFKTANKVGCS